MKPNHTTRAQDRALEDKREVREMIVLCTFILAVFVPAFWWVHHQNGKHPTAAQEEAVIQESARRIQKAGLQQHFYQEGGRR